MHIEFLVEEQSAEAALSRIVPAIIGPSISVAIRRFQGKHDLLGKLPARLAGYRRCLSARQSSRSASTSTTIRWSGGSQRR
jgi:hypothetical protein